MTMLVDNVVQQPSSASTVSDHDPPPFRRRFHLKRKQMFYPLYGAAADAPSSDSMQVAGHKNITGEGSGGAKAMSNAATGTGASRPTTNAAVSTSSSTSTARQAQGEQGPAQGASAAAPAAPPGTFASSSSSSSAPAQQLPAKNKQQPHDLQKSERRHFLPVRTTEKFLEANARFCRQYGQKRRRTTGRAAGQDDEFSEGTLTVTSCSSGASDSSEAEWENCSPKFDKTVISKAKLIHQKDRAWSCYWDLGRFYQPDSKAEEISFAERLKREEENLMQTGVAAGGSGRRSSGGAVSATATATGTSTTTSSGSTVMDINMNMTKKFFELMDGHKRHRKFVVVHNLFSEKEMEKVHAAFRNWSTSEIRDRKQNLKYRHTAYRVELQLKYLEPELYGRIIECVHLVDDVLWQKMPRCTYPELEYIVYDTRRRVGEEAVLAERERARAQLATQGGGGGGSSWAGNNSSDSDSNSKTEGSARNQPPKKVYQSCRSDGVIKKKWDFHCECMRKAAESTKNLYVKGERRDEQAEIEDVGLMEEAKQREESAMDTDQGGGTDGTIEEHVDNDSVITFILMLGQPGVDYVGGRNNFARGEKHQIRRQVQLQKGDMVLFRGERLRHSITPVTQGCRIILQGEFSKT